MTNCYIRQSGKEGGVERLAKFFGTCTLNPRCQNNICSTLGRTTSMQPPPGTIVPFYEWGGNEAVVTWVVLGFKCRAYEVSLEDLTKVGGMTPMVRTTCSILQGGGKINKKRNTSKDYIIYG